MSNRLPWLSNDDYVLVDPTWFDSADYRSRKSLNEYVLDDAKRDGLLRVISVSPQGQSMRLMPTFESQNQWSRKFPLKVTIAHHSKVHPVVFSSRRVTLHSHA